MPETKRQNEELLLVFWEAHTAPAYKNLLDGGWYFDEKTQRYRSPSGTWLGDDDLRAIALAFILSVEIQIENDTTMMIQGQVSLNNWRQQIEEDLHDEFYLLAALAAGGLDMLDDEDRDDIEGWVTTDEKIGFGIADARNRLDDFKKELEANDAGSIKQIVNRSGQYPGAGWPIYQKVLTNSHKRATDDQGRKLFLYERNRLQPAEHCHNSGHLEGCVEVSGAGWQPIGTLPPVGSRVCQFSCKCFLEFALSPDEIQ